MSDTQNSWSQQEVEKRVADIHERRIRRVQRQHSAHFDHRRGLLKSPTCEHFEKCTNSRPTICWKQSQNVASSRGMRHTEIIVRHWEASYWHTWTSHMSSTAPTLRSFRSSSRDPKIAAACNNFENLQIHVYPPFNFRGTKKQGVSEMEGGFEFRMIEWRILFECGEIEFWLCARTVFRGHTSDEHALVFKKSYFRDVAPAKNTTTTNTLLRRWTYGITAWLRAFHVLATRRCTTPVFFFEMRW